MSSRKSSELWNHFSEYGENRVRCSHCLCILKIANGSTGNLIRHMRTKHRNVRIFNKRQYRILGPKIENDPVTRNYKIEEATFCEEQTLTVWSRVETLALIDIFSLCKDKFYNFKNKRNQWRLVSEELSKIGVSKGPEKCETKWKNLLRAYRRYKFSNTNQDKFEYFNELDAVLSDNPQYNSGESSKYNVQLMLKKRICSCAKSEKQKRHEDRMALMVKKMEIEERKVAAFEDYLIFLKSNYNKL